MSFSLKTIFVIKYFIEISIFKRFKIHPDSFNFNSVKIIKIFSVKQFSDLFYFIANLTLIL